MLELRNKITLELLARFFIWVLVVFGIETFCSFYVRRFFAQLDFYFAACTLWAVILFAVMYVYSHLKLVRVTISSNLFVDMLDIYFWDLCYQVFWWMLSHYYYDKEIYSAGNFAIWLLKSLRLLWPCKALVGDAFASILPIGPFGYFSRALAVASLGPAWQRYLFYFAIVLTIPVGYLYKEKLDTDSLLFVATVPLGLALYLAHFLLMNAFYQYIQQQRFESHSKVLLAEIKRLRAESGGGALSDAQLGELHDLYLRLGEDGRKEFMRLMKGLAEFEVQERRKAFRLVEKDPTQDAAPAANDKFDTGAEAEDDP